MRVLIILVTCLITGNIALGQGGSQTLSEAEKAILADQRAPIIADSLRNLYQQRWTLGISYGLRYLGEGSLSSIADTLTFADFTQKKAFWGLEVGYYASNRLHLFVSANLLTLPREEDINSIVIDDSNGLQVEGSGNGGATINVGAGFKFYPLQKGNTRPYVSLKIGGIKAIAKGGEVSFGLGQGRSGNIAERSENYQYANVTAGFTHRMSLGTALDWNIGYLKASQSESIGGIISPTGLTTTLTLQVMIGAQK